VALLEACGWSVWWDTRIDAGETWDEVIERELDAAGCVVVAWSAASIGSRWVRSEASEGLERGILVPVHIDVSKPPLEFKLVQSIDLAGWSGEATSPRAKELVGVVGKLLGRPPALTVHEARREPSDRTRASTDPWQIRALRAAGGFVRAAKARLLVPRFSQPSRLMPSLLVGLTAGFLVLVPAVLRLSDWLGMPMPTISVARTIWAEPATQAVLPIYIDPPGALRALPNDSYVVLDGLPVGVSLSGGQATSPRRWSVPLLKLSELKAIIPAAGVSGRSEITVSLMSGNGTVLAESRTALVVRQPPMLAPPAKKALVEPQQNHPIAAPARMPPGKPATLAVAALSTKEKARAEELLARGDRHLAEGNISSARMFFQRAAEMGLALGAFRLAETHDPGDLFTLQVRGLRPDREEALKYRRARELGYPEADEWLDRLGAK